MQQSPTKKKLRSQLKTTRAKLTNKAALDSALNERLIRWLGTQVFSSVFSYLSTDDEASTWPLVQHLLHKPDCRLSCPKIINRSQMVAVELSSLADLEAGALGIKTTKANTPTTQAVDIAIVPGLAFSLAGARLGYGAGYYDRWFETHPSTLRVALCFDSQLLEYVPTETHDIPMDYIVTEKTIHTCLAVPRSRT